MTILLIEHKLDMVMHLSDRVCVLDDGVEDRRGNAGGRTKRPGGHRSLSGTQQRRARRRRGGGRHDDAASRPRSRQHVLRRGAGAFRSLARGRRGPHRLAARRQRQRQIDDDEGHPRPCRAAIRNRHVQRRAHRRLARSSGDPGRNRLGARGAADLPADDGARKPADGRLCRGRTAKPSRTISSGC